MKSPRGDSISGRAVGGDEATTKREAGVAEGDAGRAVGGVVFEELARDSAAIGNGGNGVFMKEVRDEGLPPGIAGRGAVGGGCGDGE